MIQIKKTKQTTKTTHPFTSPPPFPPPATTNPFHELDDILLT